MAKPLRIAIFCLLVQAALWGQTVRLEMLQEPLTAEEERQVSQSLDWIVAAYQRQGLRPRPTVRVRVLPGMDAFRSYQLANRSVRDGAPLSTTGYYSGSRQELVVWRSRRFIPIVVHEAQHALLRSTFKDPPKWLNEGLSECFEGLVLVDERLELRPQGPRYRKVLRHVDESDFPKQVTDVLTMSAAEFNRMASDRGLDSYTRSWALVYFLWSQPEGEALTGQIMRGIRSGQNSAEAVDRAYPGGLEKLRPDLSEFYRTLDKRSAP